MVRFEMKGAEIALLIESLKINADSISEKASWLGLNIINMLKKIKKYGAKSLSSEWNKKLNGLIAKYKSKWSSLK